MGETHQKDFSFSVGKLDMYLQLSKGEGGD